MELKRQDRATCESVARLTGGPREQLRPRSRGWLRTWLRIGLLALVSCGGGQPAARLYELPEEQPAVVGSVEGPGLFAGFDGIDLGRIWQGAVREVSFPLTSVGTEPLHIASIKASCGCTLVSASVLEGSGRRPLVFGEDLAPGTRLAVDLRFDSRGREGREAKFVTVYSDDPAGRLRLEVSVETEPLLVATPAPLAFGRVFPAAGLEARSTISASDGQPFGLELVGTEALPPGLSLDLAEEQGGTSWQLGARLAPGTAAGNLLAHVTLVSDRPFEAAGELDELGLDERVFAEDGTPRHYLDLWVTAAVVDSIEVSPPYLPFGLLMPGSLTSASTRIECFDPALVEAFCSAPPVVALTDPDGAALEGPAAGAFTPTLRLVQPGEAGARPLSGGALAAWDLEVAAKGFPGQGQNRLVGRLELDFAAAEIPDRSLDFQVILQP